MSIKKEDASVTINGVSLEGVWIDEINLATEDNVKPFKLFPTEATLTITDAEINPEFQKWLKEEQTKHEQKEKLNKMAHFKWMKGQGY